MGFRIKNQDDSNYKISSLIKIRYHKGWVKLSSNHVKLMFEYKSWKSKSS